MPKPWEIFKLPPDQSYKLGEPVVEAPSWLRGTSSKIAIIACVVALGMLVAIYRRTGDPTAHLLLGLAMVFPLIFPLFRSRRDPFDPRPLDASSTRVDTTMDEMLRRATGDPPGTAPVTPESSTSDSDPTSPESLVPEGAKKIYDLKDLPPGLASSPAVQKLMERAGAHGAWVKITDKSAETRAELGPATVKVRVGVKRFGQPIRMSATETMSDLPPELTSGDPRQIADWVESHRPRSPMGGNTLSPKAFRLTIDAGTLIVVCAALVVTGLCLWMLYSR